MSIGIGRLFYCYNWQSNNEWIVVMKNARKIKDLLYEQVARIGKVFSSPKRLELIELLCQGEKTVEALADEASISMKLASAHLRELRGAHLVKTERQGKNIIYRLADKAVSDLWVHIHAVAEDRLIELQMELQKIATQPNDLVPNDREMLMKMARRGEVVVLDVRPTDEYLATHLPFARSIPIDELRKEGFKSAHWRDGVAEWKVEEIR